MNCEQACEFIALAASGDVTADEQSAIVAHMADCAACRDEAAAFSAISGELAAMRNDAVPDYAFAAVRAHVASEIAGRKRPAWLSAWPAFAAVVACSVMLVILLSPAAPGPDRLVLPEVPPVVALVPSVESPAVVPPVRRIRKPAPPKIHKPAEPLVVKMLTDDPEVIIYWIADARREGQEKEIIQ